LRETPSHRHKAAIPKVCPYLWMNPNRSDGFPPDTVATFLEGRSPSSSAQLLSSASLFLIFAWTISFSAS
ncbi:hypothetical protein, partial [Saccharospirillum sp.]|uniref:hypothetical protein n=1 Tax=Saccharospirillum sp. TaxID=2033801 RepID=UPI0032974936